MVRDPAERRRLHPEQAKAAALQVLPDILHYDRTQPATYPNGRVPTDVYSLRFAWLTNGKVPPSGLKPHDDLLARFPTSARPTLATARPAGPAGGDRLACQAVLGERADSCPRSALRSPPRSLRRDSRSVAGS